jgi:hypothetical protein
VHNNVTRSQNSARGCHKLLHPFFDDYKLQDNPFRCSHTLPFVQMAPGHIPAYLFATLIASFCYGELEIIPSWPPVTFLVSGIAVTLFIESIGTILRKRSTTGKINLPFVLPSVLVFILATVVSLVSLRTQTYFDKLSLSECYRFMDEHTCGFCSSRSGHRGLP